MLIQRVPVRPSLQRATLGLVLLSADGRAPAKNFPRSAAGVCGALLGGLCSQAWPPGGRATLPWPWAEPGLGQSLGKEAERPHPAGAAPAGVLLHKAHFSSHPAPARTPSLAAPCCVKLLHHGQHPDPSQGLSACPSSTGSRSARRVPHFSHVAALGIVVTDPHVFRPRARAFIAVVTTLQSDLPQPLPGKIPNLRGPFHAAAAPRDRRPEPTAGPQLRAPERQCRVMLGPPSGPGPSFASCPCCPCSCSVHPRQKGPEAGS